MKTSSHTYVLLLILWIGTMVPRCVSGQDFGEEQQYAKPYDQTPALQSRVLTLHVAGGLATPLGTFASSDFLNYYSGYAQRGIYGNIFSFTYWVHKHYGIGGSWFRSSYEMNASRYFSYYSKVYVALTFKGEAEKWLVQSLMVSGVASIPGRIADLDFRASFGLGHVMRPEVSAVVTNDTTGLQVVRWTQARASANTLAFGAGMNLRIHIKAGFDALFNIEYQRMKPKFTVLQVYNGNVLDEDHVVQPIEILYTGLGVALTL